MFEPKSGLRGAALVCALVLGMGCGDDGPGTTANPTFDAGRDVGGGGGGLNNPVPDAGPDTSPEPDAAPDTNDDEPDADIDTGRCEGFDCGFEFTAYGECLQTLDMGVIDASASTVESFYGNTTNLDSNTDSTCAANAADASEFVFRFQVSQTALVNFRLNTLDNVDWATSVREGACDSASEFTCRDAAVDSFRASPNTDYFLVVEPNSGVQQGDFQIRVEIEPTECDELGGRTCAQDNLEICTALDGVQSYACGGTCANDACAGDSCDQAVDIPSTASENTFEGELAAYQGDIDAGAIPSCAALGAPSTPGAERIYKVTGLMANQTLEINATLGDSNDDAILIMRGCGQAAECVAYKELGDRLTWTATEAGDYTIVIDNLDELNQPFKHVITVR
jgi:hypothetical protein